MDSSYHDGSDYHPEVVRFYDVAHEGAQIRAIAGSLENLPNLRGMTPRSVVVVTSDHTARAAARFVNSVRSPLRLPLVITDSLPGYVGALDVVLVVGEKADDPELSRALITADRRGAATVLIGPSRGPILDDAPSDTFVMPALPTTVGSSPARAISGIGTILDLLEEDPGLIAARLAQTADAVDAEVEQLSPERDAVVNPGRQLREFAGQARIIHTGAGSRQDFAVAEMVATLWGLKGISGTAVPGDELPVAPPPVNDIFHDPYLDGETGLIPLKTVVWAQRLVDATAPPNTFFVSCDTPEAETVAGALTLITRGLAATTYDLPTAAAEDF